MINVDKHTVNSPYYPGVYVPNLHCTVTLMVDEGLTLILKIIIINLQPAHEGNCSDYLLIDGAMEEPTPLCGTYSKEVISTEPLFYGNLAIVNSDVFSEYTECTLKFMV